MLFEHLAVCIIVIILAGVVCPIAFDTLILCFILFY